MYQFKNKDIRSKIVTEAKRKEKINEHVWIVYGSVFANNVYFL